MDKITVTSLKQIEHPKGDILHALKRSEESFSEFGEAYFSSVNESEIKGWKKHNRMTLNLIVPVGEIEFTVYDEESKEFFNISLSRDNYKRLTIMPGLWVAFKGKSKDNLLLNLSSLEHDPSEAENIDLDGINYAWK